MDMKNNPSLNTETVWVYASAPTVVEFQSNHNTGKWCISLDESEVDAVWGLIKKACSSGTLHVAKCSTLLNMIINRYKYPTYLICVYTTNWHDAEELQRVRKVLYDLGITQPLKYKCDHKTIDGVYGTDDEFLIDEAKIGV